MNNNYFKKAFRVSKDARKQATKCKCNFRCIADKDNPECGKGQPMCPVLGTMSHEDLYVLSSGTSDCPYLKKFGYDHYVCSCPVRNEIYKRYRI